MGIIKSLETVLQIVDERAAQRGEKLTPRQRAEHASDILQNQANIPVDKSGQTFAEYDSPRTRYGD